MAKSIILRGGTLIDGTGAASIPNGAIRFEDGKITAIGTVADFGEGGIKDAEVYDVKGQTIMPGLINCHEHLDNKYGLKTFQARAAEPAAYLVARAVRNALIDLQEGVTTIRFIAYKHMNHLPLKRAINEGMILGPHIVAAGPCLAMTGGHGWEVCIEVDGVDAIRKAARQLLKEGVDVMKCMASGGFVSQGGDYPWSPQLTIEEMRAAFDEAHKAGKPTTVHCHPPKGIQWAIEAGADCIEHGGLIDQPTAELMAKKGIWLVPTLGEGWMVANHGKELGQPDWLIQAVKETGPDRRKRFGYALKAGVKMALGTDVWPSTATEMKLMQERGMAPMDVIVAATNHGAQVCNLGDQTGTLEKGKWADAIVVDGNPLDDMSVMERVKMVFKDGVLYRPEALAAATGRYPW